MFNKSKGNKRFEKKPLDYYNTKKIIVSNMNKINSK